MKPCTSAYLNLCTSASYGRSGRGLRPIKNKTTAYALLNKFKNACRCFIFCTASSLNEKRPRDVLSSQAVTHQVLSALKDFTSVFGMSTGVSPSPLSRDQFILFICIPNLFKIWTKPSGLSKQHKIFVLSNVLIGSRPRPISTGQLHTLPHFHLQPIYLVVFQRPYFFRMRYLILRGASCLDAFSTYPCQT